MENINQHIDQNIKKIGDSQISPQSKRHLIDELESLEAYKQNHPEDTHDPTSLELYCDQNPSALECKIYED